MAVKIPGRARKAAAAAATAFATTLGASLWQAAAGSPLSSQEVYGSLGLAVASALAAAGAVFGVKNAGQIDVASLPVNVQHALVQQVPDALDNTTLRAVTTSSTYKPA